MILLPVQASGMGCDRAGAPEFDDLLTYVHIVTLGTLQPLSEVLEVLQVAAALLHLSLEGSQCTSCRLCLVGSSLRILHMTGPLPVFCAFPETLNGTSSTDPPAKCSMTWILPFGLQKHLACRNNAKTRTADGRGTSPV